jgi:hypothetical protein
MRIKKSFPTVKHLTIPDSPDVVDYDEQNPTPSVWSTTLYQPSLEKLSSLVLTESAFDRRQLAGGTARLFHCDLVSSLSQHRDNRWLKRYHIEAEDERRPAAEKHHIQPANRQQQRRDLLRDSPTNIPKS